MRNHRNKTVFIAGYPGPEGLCFVAKQALNAYIHNGYCFNISSSLKDTRVPLHLTTLRADIRVNGTLEDDILSEESDEGLIIWDCESFRPIRVALDMYVRGKDVAVVINENYLVGNVESSRDVDELLNYMKLPSCRDTYEILKYYYYYKITKGVHRNIIRIARQMIRRWLNKDNVTRQLIIGDQSISRRTREE